VQVLCACNDSGAALQFFPPQQPSCNEWLCDLNVRAGWEDKRTFTRASVDPLTCRFGGNASFLMESPELTAARKVRKRAPGDRTARRREQARQEARKVGKKMEILEAQAQQDRLEQLLKRLVKAEKMTKEQGVSLLTELAELAVSGQSERAISLVRQDLEENLLALESGEEAAKRPRPKPPVSFLRGARKSKDLNSDEASADEFSDADDPDLAEEAHLVSGLRSRDDEEYLGELLNEYCPQLRSTPRLQDKALRCVFSVGVDVVILDAELSAMAGKLALRPEDMLPSSATDKIFGNFSMELNTGDSSDVDSEASGGSDDEEEGDEESDNDGEGGEGDNKRNAAGERSVRELLQGQEEARQQTEPQHVGRARRILSRRIGRRSTVL
jgi:hypothetical protein